MVSANFATYLSRIQKRSNRLIEVALACFVVILLMASYRTWHVIELKAYDLRIELFDILGIGQTSASSRLVVVGIEEKDTNKIKPLVFWYPEIGRFLSLMKENEASVIGIDLIPVHRLGATLRQAAEAILTEGIHKEQRDFLETLGDRADEDIERSILNATKGMKVIQAILPAKNPEDELLPFFNIEAVRMASSDFDTAPIIYPPDSDSIIRRLHFSRGDTQPNFALAVYRGLGGADIKDRETVLINYLIKGIPYYRFTDVMSGKITKDSFQKRAVILSYISRYEDMHATPTLRMNGGSIQALATETLLTASYLREAGLLFNLLVIILLSLCGYVAVTRLKPRTTTFSITLIISLFVLIDLLLLEKGYLVDLFPAVLSPIIVAMVIYPYRYVVEERGRKKIYETFSYYVDRKVIDDMIERDIKGLLMGEKKDMCVLFLDIRDFTTLSQNAEADKIVLLLNLFFGNVSEIVQRNEGMVNKFMGDGVLAFFASGGNPVKNAVRSSVEIISAVETLNTDGRVQHLFPAWELRVGIGLHYGQVIVGNIGSERKMDFTIIGDSVNIASRVEGLTKELNRPILLTGAVYELIKEDIQCEFLGAWPLKGVVAPVKIYDITMTNSVNYKSAAELQGGLS